MQTFMLILHLHNPLAGGFDTYILDHGLTASDCIAAHTDYTQAGFNPNAHFTCEPERKQSVSK